MTKKMEFLEVVAQYGKMQPEEISMGMRFREDLGFSSLDFMSFLGELEDTFDVELDEEKALEILTVEEAFSLLNDLLEEEAAS